MKFKLEISTDGAAFHSENCRCDDGSPNGCESERSREVRRLLRNASQKLDDGHLSGLLRDHNGNRVGVWEFHAS